MKRYYIEVDFYDSLGTIDLSICDESGNTVYQQSVNTSEEHQVFINISSFDKGIYIIAFVNSQTNLSGEFDL